MKKILKTLLVLIIVLLVAIVAGLFWLTANDRAIDYQVSSEGLDIPQYDHKSIDFEPSYDKTKTIPFTAGAIIDIDGDGVEEVFFGGGIDQQDAFYRFDGGDFVDITTETGWQKSTPDKTFSAVALDLDKDGDNDMLVTRQSGVWLYNNQGGQFSGEKLVLDLDPKTVPLSVAVADLNRDGLFDMYVAGYIARKHVEGETIFNQPYGGYSALYINRGDGVFEDHTEASGLQYQHNTFQAVFVDVDGDLLEDLVVAHDTGTVKTWKNLGDLQFEDRPNPTSDYFSYPMGIAVGDYNRDGLVDFFFSNVGSTTPDAIVRGDLRDDQVLNKKWILFENQGGFGFKDVAEQAKVADYEFSWGAILEDFNLDGREDLVVSENYVGFPTHILPTWRLDGRFMLQNQRGEFAALGAEAGVQNRYFGISPLAADFNQDGALDLVHVNLLGPQQVFLSRGANANYLKVALDNNVDSIGAKVTVTLENGDKQYRFFVLGEGLCSDQSHVLHFGLGDLLAASVKVAYLNGSTLGQEGPFANQQIGFRLPDVETDAGDLSAVEELVENEANATLAEEAVQETLPKTSEETEAH